MILEIDAGNSRIKWRVIDAHQQAVIAGNATNTRVLAEADAGFPMLDKVFSSLRSQLGNNLTRARVSSVRGLASRTCCQIGCGKNGILKRNLRW